MQNKLFENPASGAIISDCGTYRYRLWRTWDERKPKILWIMLNPSTADDNQDDPTIRRIINFSKAWGYGGLYVGNLFAYRSTDPELLYYEQRKGLRDIIGPENDDHINTMSLVCNEIVFAWGNDGGLMGRCGDIIDLFPSAKCLQKTKTGHPSHPLFLKSTLTLFPYKY